MCLYFDLPEAVYDREIDRDFFGVVLRLPGPVFLS